MFITADNELTAIYVDGVSIDISGWAGRTEWKTADSVTIAEGATLLAVHATDKGGEAGLLASSAGGIISNSAWKCSRGPVGDDWSVDNTSLATL